MKNFKELSAYLMANKDKGYGMSPLKLRNNYEIQIYSGGIEANITEINSGSNDNLTGVKFIVREDNIQVVPIIANEARYSKSVTFPIDDNLTKLDSFLKIDIIESLMSL